MCSYTHTRFAIAVCLMAACLAVRSQTVSTAVGNGTMGFAGDGDSAANAELNRAGGVFVDAAGNIYVSDRYNYRIRKVDVATGNISTVAGNGSSGYTGDGALATAAKISGIRGNVFVNGAGDIYLGDTGNNVVRAVDHLTQFINTVPGTSGAGLSNPITVYLDNAGDIFIASLWNGKVFELPAGGTMQVVAGNGSFAYSGDGGPATSAAIADASAIVVCGGNILIADDLSNVIRMVEASTGNIKTVAGSGNPGGYSGDGGPATGAKLYAPYGLLLDDSGNLFIADSGNHVIRKVDAGTGIISTVAGLWTGSGSSYGAFLDGAALQARFNWPIGLAEDPRNGDLLVADSSNNRVRLVTGVLSPPASPRACPGTIPTTTTVSSSANPSPLNQSVTFTALVTPAAGVQLTGKVKFMDGASTLGTVALDSSNTATYATSTLAAGDHSMKAIYLGDLSHLTGTGTMTQTIGAIPATLTTTAPSNITATGALGGGNITADGGATVTARGVCWGTSANPDLSGTCAAEGGTGTGSFTVPITGLAAGMPYHVRAYATNSAGTGYGNELTFTTSSSATLATVSTSPVTAITTTSAKTGGNVTANGGASVTARGVCWSTSANPDLTASCLADAGTGTGAFTSPVTGLTAGTPYHLRAYATNAVGTAYGNDVAFSTSAGIGPFAYVSNSGDDTVTVIDTATNLVYGDPIPVPTGYVPYGVAVNAQGTRVYVTDFGHHAVSVIDGTTKTVTGSPINVGSYPIYAALNPAGTFLYVVNYVGKLVSVIDTSSNAVVGSGITVGNGPQAIAISPSGARAWVANGDADTVSALDLATNTVIGSPISVGGYPQGIVVNPAGTRVYVANGDDDTVSVIDAASNTVVGSPIAVGHGPTGLSLDPAGAFLYVTNWNDGNAGSVSVIDTSTNTVVGSPIAVGAAPVGIAVNSAGTYVYVANSGDDTVSVIDASTRTVVGAPIPVGSGPMAFGQFLPPPAVLVPAVITASATSITDSSATLGGNVTAQGGSAVTARGACWSQSAYPSTSDSCTHDGSGAGVFTSSATGLSASTSYHARAYATNSSGTAYGDDVQFTTSAPAPAAPQVTTAAVTGITTISAVGGGEVTTEGGASVTVRGVCWSLSANPTTSATCTSDGAGLGVFASAIGGLSPSTPYHVRAYATSTVGTSYGSDVSFTTQSTQTITFAPLADRPLSASPFTVSATASSGLAVSFASATPAACTVSGSTVTLATLGTCTIQATQAGNAAYAAATPVSRGFQITEGPQSQIITFGPLPNRAFGSGPFTLSATASSGLPVSFASTTPAVCAVFGNSVVLAATGQCSIQATQAGNASYAAATPVAQSFLVTQGTQTILFDALPDRSVGSAPFTISAASTSGLPVGFASRTPTVCSVSGSTVTLLAAGTCTVRATQPGDANWSAASPVSQSFEVTQPAPNRWQLLWSDEFNGTAGTPPDPPNWNYDLGPGWMSGGIENNTNSPNNVFEDGKGDLVIRVLSDGHGGYTSARLQTGAPGASTRTADRSWTYGRVEARMKLPFGKGIWPAFRMIGEDYDAVGWPNCGEIGIMENFGTFQNNAGANNGIPHGPGYSTDSALPARFTLPFGEMVYDDYHVYAVEWSSNAVTWYVDGTPYHTLTPATLPAGARWVFNAPFFLLLDVAVGGPNAFLGTPDSTVAFPQDLLVDYIRVYQGATMPDTTPSVTPGRIVNAASYLGALAPGSLAAVYGNRLADAVHLVDIAESGGHFPKNVAGVTVSVNGVSAPLTYVSPSQINFQIPWETAPGLSVPVRVARNGVASNIERVTIASSAAPAFFMKELVDGVVWVTGNPGDGCPTPASECSVRAGSTYELWANGLGPKASALQDGVPAPPATLQVPGGPESCQLAIDGHPATVVYCGAAPTQIIDQVNFVYPPGVSTATPYVRATLTIDGVTSHFRVPAPIAPE